MTVELQMRIMLATCSHITNSQPLVPNAEPNAKKILPSFARLLQCLKRQTFSQALYTGSARGLLVYNTAKMR